MTVKTYFPRLVVIIAVIIAVVWWLQPMVKKFLPADKMHRTVPQSVNWSQTQVDAVRVYKTKRQLQLLQNGKIVKVYAIRLGFDPIGHKVQEGDGKTPEGRYVLDWHNANSQFYKSIHISYPNANDLAVAKAKGVSAGGDVMIHGSMKKTGGSQGQALYDYIPNKDWTLGCIAVSNQDMDEIFDHVKDGTPIDIFP